LFASAILSTIAVLPIMLGRLFAPRFERTESASLVRAVRLAPAIMFAVAVCGVSILGLQSFITVYGMSNGLGLSEASLLLTAFMLGSILLEMPVAWLSDFFDRRYVMIALVLLSLIAAVYLPIAIYDPWSARVLLFLWGGVIGGLYSICLAVTAERFTGPDLVAANAAFSIMDASGGMVGILAIGLAMQLLGVDGLPYVIMFASVAYFSFALTRYQVR
jgi:MFS family permease